MTFKQSLQNIIMYRKIPRLLLAIVFLLCFIFITIAEAQLNFSTGWGKRSQRPRVPESRNPECPANGRPSLEQLLNLYTFIQIEARRILDCQRSNK